MYLISAKEEKDAYTSEILTNAKKCQIIGGRSTVYPLLTRLKNDAADYLSIAGKNPISWTSRKYYGLNRRRKGIFKRTQRGITWNELAGAVNTITTQN